MNKYLLMSAAAALATTAAGTAQAGTYSVHFGTASGGSYCDGEIGTSNAGVYAGRHIYTKCSTLDTNLLTEGLGEKQKGNAVGKKNVNFSDMTFGYNYHENYAISFDLATPIAAGGKWDLWVSFVASSSYIGNSGTLKAGK